MPPPLNLHVGNVTTRIEGFMTNGVKVRLDEELSYLIPDAGFAVRAWEEKQRKALIEEYGYEVGSVMPLPRSWDGRQHFFSRAKSTIPTGLLRRAIGIFKENSVPITITNHRVRPDPLLPIHISGFTPYDFQTEIANEAFYRQRGMIQLGTGGGKGSIIPMLIERVKCPTVVLIHRETIYRQLIDRISSHLGIKVGQCGSGVFEDADICVAMTPSAVSRGAWLKKFGCVILDELHHCASRQAYSTLQSCTNAFYRYGLTATPWREDGGEMFLEAAFAGFICNMGPSELIRRGRLTRPKIFFLDNPRITKWEMLSYPNQYSKTVVENKFRNQLIVDAVKYFVGINKTVLIAVTQIKHGKILMDMLKENLPGYRFQFVKGEDNSDTKQEALRKLNNHEIDGAVATTVFGEGVDVPNLGCLINAKGQDSKVDVIQLIGRVLRKTDDKEFAYFIDIFDHQQYTLKHTKRRFEVLGEEPLFHVEHVLSVDDMVKSIETPSETASV